MIEVEILYRHWNGDAAGIPYIVEGFLTNGVRSVIAVLRDSNLKSLY